MKSSTSQFSIHVSATRRSRGHAQPNTTKRDTLSYLCNPTTEIANLQELRYMLLFHKNHQHHQYHHRHHHHHHRHHPRPNFKRRSDCHHQLILATQATFDIFCNFKQLWADFGIFLATFGHFQLSIFRQFFGNCKSLL